MKDFASSKDVYSLQEIQDILPHRYPFLLIDRVIKKEKSKTGDRIGSRVWTIKNVTINEPFFQGHFPNRPIMPGVLLIEAMAQTAAFACLKENEGFKTVSIASISSARFRRPVLPGYQLLINAKVLKQKKSIFVVSSEVHSDNNLMAEAEIIAHVEFSFLSKKKNSSSNLT